MGGGRTHEDRPSDTDGAVNHRDWIAVTLTQLSFLFTLTYPLFIFSILGWPPHATYHSGLPVWVGPSLPEERFSVIVISPSYLVLSHIPCFVLTKGFILEQPGFTPVCTLYALASTHWVYPYNTLQHPVHILGLPLHMQRRLA